MPAVVAAPAALVVLAAVLAVPVVTGAVTARIGNTSVGAAVPPGELGPDGAGAHGHRAHDLLVHGDLGRGAAAATGALGGNAAPVQAPASGELLVTFLHTSDEHSALLPSPLVEHRPGASGAARGGFARLASVVEAERARRAEAGEPVLVTSAGDNLSGTPFAWLMLEGAAPELGLMTELGYDVITLGNHEFDYGSERLAEYLAAAGFPAAAERTAIVASNTTPPPAHPLADRGIRRTHLMTLPNGLRIGFLGLLGDGAARFAPLAPPVEFERAEDAARAAVAELRDAGAHVVVAITHSGLDEDRALAQAVPGIDVILGGHDHRLIEEPLVEAGTLIVHPGAHLEQVVRLELGYEPMTGVVRFRNPETGAAYVVPLDDSVPESPWMAARVDEYRRQLEDRVAALTEGGITGLDQVVARSAFPLPARPAFSETPLGNFVTDAMRSAAEAATGEGVDFAFQANGLIRGDLVPGWSAWNRDRVVFYDLARVVGMGFGPDGRPGYPLVAAWLTGDEVRRVLEVSVLLSQLLRDSYYLQVSGLRAEYDPRRAVLARIPVRGTPIPSGRAVLSAERLAVGHGGAAAEWVPLERGDTALYRIVTDQFVFAFLPMVGRLVPRLSITPRDRNRVPLEDLDDAVVYRNGRELKVWQAALEYAAAQPRGEDGEPRIRAEYAAPEGRLVEVRAAPLWLWPAAAGALLLALAAALILLRRRSRPRFTDTRRLMGRKPPGDSDHPSGPRD